MPGEIIEVLMQKFLKTNKGSFKNLLRYMYQKLEENNFFCYPSERWLVFKNWLEWKMRPPATVRFALEGKISMLT